jgi:PAS domain S-box-containing protein
LANDAFIDMDPNGTITGWNRQAEATFGWSRKEAVGRLVAETIVPSRFREAHGRGLAHFMATGEGPVLNKRIELSALHRDGHEFPVELTVSVLREDGAAVGFNAFVHDISDRKHAEEALRQREEMLQAVFDASPDIITIIGPDGTLQPASRAIRDILGYGPEEHAGKRQSVIIHPEDREQAALALRSLTQGEKSADVRYRARHADGRWVVLESRAHSIGDAEGKPRGVVEISRDITERVALEESLVQAKREAERANHAKSEFLSRMSHELRTPLNAILGFGQLLEMDLHGADANENVQYILRGGRLLLDLVNELLDIARIESGRTVLSLEPVRVGDALQEVMTLVRPLATVRGVRIESRASDAADGTVLADPQRLRQVLLNLFSNAIKYNREGGVVTVGGVEIAGDRLRISISDEGDGIAEDDLERLFTPFERLGVERTDVEGTGLGLAVSKSLVEAMGGSIGVRSEPGKGSTFVLELALVGGSEDP